VFFAGLKIADVGVSTRPKFVGKSGATLYGQAQIAVDGDLVFVPVANSSLQIVNVASVAYQPQRDIYLPEDLRVEDLIIIGGRAFTAGSPTLCSVPISPRLTGPFTTVLDAAVMGRKMDRDGNRSF